MIDNFCVITFADKEPYLSEAENLKNLCVNNNIQFKLYDFNWLRNSAVYYSFKDIFWKKKCGYCAWKPYAILDALKLYDKVLYLDSSMLFNPEMINKYIRENDNEDIVSPVTSLKQELYTKQETFIIMEAHEAKYMEDNLYWTGSILATKKAKDFLYEWLYYCLQEECVSDECILSKNEKLKYHLYDQSIYSILYSKYNKKRILNSCFCDTREANHIESIIELFGEECIDKQRGLNIQYKNIYDYNSSVYFKK
jgi:hypothetical protein